MVLWLIGILLISFFFTRLALIIYSLNDLENAFLLIPVSIVVGFIFDLFIALCLTAPFSAIMMILPSKWKLSSVFRWIVPAALFAFVFGSIYLGIAEIVFFDEFSSRFNYVAVDYLIFPHEVFINIWDTYPIVWIIMGTSLVSLIISWMIRKKLYARLRLYPSSFIKRLEFLISQLVLLTVLYLVLSTGFSRVSENRILNEITLNGVYSFVHAGFTNELDYNLYYSEMDESTAYHVLRQNINDDHSTFIHDNDSETIDRIVTSDNDLHRFNIVLVLEESFGSNFIGALDPEGLCLTSRFDSLAAEGMLFTHIYATGNRTVRGLEAALLSFPPIPGRSVVKRPGCENLFSLPSILNDKDYNTVFLYGGLSYFDNFGHFAASNGFDRVIDELDFKDPIFSTIWGVCDEDLFNKSLQVFDSLASDNKPFLATMITVSNHSPYTYPEGRIPFNPEERKRENAVRYSDYAIGKFIEDAHSHSFFDSTLFVFMADHGARVYGSEEIPLRSYKIPVLFYNPVLIPRGQRIGTLGSQLDLSPTILDLLGFDYNSMFFGRSILSTPKDRERALMSHNRDVALLKNDTLAVLNIQKQMELWRFDSADKIHRIDDSIKSDLESDAISYYMTAYKMFKDKKLHPLPN